MRGNQTIRVNGRPIDLVHDKGSKAYPDLYDVQENGLSIGTVRSDGLRWLYSLADDRQHRSVQDAVAALIEARADRTPLADQPHVVIGYIDPSSDKGNAYTTANILAVTGSEAEAHWLWNTAITLADKQRLALYTRQSYWKLVRSAISVRSADHVEALSAFRGPIVRVLTPGKGLSTRNAALKKWGSLHGYYGDTGGWIHRKGERRPIGHGWRCLDRHNGYPQSDARVIRVGDKFRVIEGPLETPAQVSARLVEAAIS